MPCTRVLHCWHAYFGRAKTQVLSMIAPALVAAAVPVCLGPFSHISSSLSSLYRAAATPGARSELLTPRLAATGGTRGVRVEDSRWQT